MTLYEVMGAIPRYCPICSHPLRQNSLRFGTSIYSQYWCSSQEELINSHFRAIGTPTYRDYEIRFSDGRSRLFRFLEGYDLDDCTFLLLSFHNSAALFREMGDFRSANVNWKLEGF